jgi:CO/xanthine dehydrogenase Mo-binding subunit
MPPAVGSAVQRIDVLDKLLGTATFTADLALPGMLHAHLLLSAHAHARIRSIDTSAAEQMPGVCAVLSANNTPPYRFGSEFPDQELFARHKALHRGAVLAAVAAQDAATAAEAVQRIRVEYEPLPVVVDVLAAVQPGAPILHEELASYPGVNPQHVAGNICYRTSVTW